jgi:hypothetical protein
MCTIKPPGNATRRRKTINRHLMTTGDGDDRNNIMRTTSARTAC